MSATDLSVEERVQTLEQANKGHRRATLILAIMFLMSIVFNVLQSKTFSGRWMAIHDKQDRISAWWDDGGLELHDKTGTVRAKLGLFSDGSPYLQLYDGQHHLRSQLFLYGGDTGYLMLWDKHGKGTRFPPSKSPLP